MSLELVDEGLRRKVTLFCENYYIYVSRSHVFCKTPYENRPENQKRREIIEKVCEEISATLEYLNWAKMAEGIWWDEEPEDVKPDWVEPHFKYE